MAKRQASAVHKEIAVLFLLAVALAGPVALLVWGREAASSAPPEAQSPATTDERPVIPAEGGAWAVKLDGTEAGRLVGLFLDSLTALAQGKDLPPAGKDGVDAPVFITVYASGGARARQAARTGGLGLSVQEAAVRLFRQAGGQVDPSVLRVRLDVVRSVRRFPVEERLAFAERGLSEPIGIAVQGGSGPRFLPGDIVDYRSLNNAELLSTFCHKAGLGPQDWRKDDVRMWTLRTVSFVNDTAGSRRVLPSARGLTPPGPLTTATLMRSTRLAGDYLVGARAPDDSFLTFWNPLSELRGGCESLTVQAAAAAALGEIGRMWGSEKQLSACYDVISFLMHYTDMDPHDPGMAFSTRKEVCQELLETEASARVLEALCRFHRASGLAEPLPWIQTVADFLLFMQRDDGLFELKYDPKTQLKTLPASVAEAVRPQAAAILALALAHRELGRPELLKAAQKALDALAAGPEDRAWTSEDGSALVEAILEVNRAAPQERYVQLAERVAAARRKEQLDEANAPGQDVVGASLSAWPPQAGATADDLEVFAGVCLLAPFDRENLAAADRAARCLMGLQFLPENSYYLPQPEAARGGFREQPGSNLVRLQTVETALRGLMNLTQVKLSENDRDS